MSGDWNGEESKCAGPDVLAAANRLPLNLLLDPALELGNPTKVRIDDGPGRRIRVLGQVLIPRANVNSVTGVTVTAAVIDANAAIPQDPPNGAQQGFVEKINDAPGNPDPQFQSWLYKFTDDSEVPNERDRRVRVPQTGLNRLVVWATVTYNNGQPDVCLSQTCLQFDAAANQFERLAYVELFTVSKPLPPLQAGGPLNSYTIDNANLKLCECLATADRRSSGIIKVAARIFHTMPITAPFPGVTSPSGLADGWQVVDYQGQAQASVKFRNDLYSGVQQDYRIPGASNDSNNYLVVLALFRNSPNNWVEAYNATRIVPIRFTGALGICSP